MGTIVEGMYVRVPIDLEHPEAPRDFITGQVARIDHDLDIAIVYFHDPFGYRKFFENIPQYTEPLPLANLQHCRIFTGSLVKIGKIEAYVLEHKKQADGKFLYYLRDTKTQAILRRDESDLEAPFNAGDADPVSQLKNYEFQNPCWYLGRQVVLKTSTIMEHFMYGFDILSGCKIFLKAHQMRTIMKCLSKVPCHIMLADEVGLGKTIEAASVLKIYLSEHAKQRVLIAVPMALVAQWRSELLFKFNLVDGENDHENIIRICAIEELQADDDLENWDFTIIDEVHNVIHAPKLYNIVHELSIQSNNLILLSATPIQQRHEEYLELLRLISPKQYDNMSKTEFEDLLDKQSKIQKVISDLLMSIDAIKTDILPDLEEGENAHENEDVLDEQEAIQGSLEKLSEIIDDPELERMIKNVDYSSEDLGIYEVQVILSYACDNYQISRDIIRGRRDALGVYPKEDAEFSKRECVEIPYAISEEENFYENNAFQALTNWITENAWTREEVEHKIIPLLEVFFSSPWAYVAALKKTTVPIEIVTTANRWLEDEEEAIAELDCHMSGDADQYYSRITKILAYIKGNLTGRKIVAFTDYKETFDKYLSVFRKVLGQNSVAGYAAHYEQSSIDIYRFQKDDNCNILICDRTGGEGHNLQIADFVVHIDLPWNVNEIEQRIGRVDRLGRDVAVPVTSIVIYSKDTYEEQLFHFWDQGMDIFHKSLSGMEIIMKETNEKIVDSVQKDINHGLEDLIPEMIKGATQMKEAVRREQIYDSHIMRFDPLYDEIDRMLSTYARTDNETFARAMCSWASLAGFRLSSSSGNRNIIKLSANAFSFNSARNVMLVPPDWTSYMRRQINKIALEVQQGYDREVNGATSLDGQIIQGTFDRQLAIKNDYLHFFAPGDEVYDCIINNAKASYKGMCCAMAVNCNLDWQGFCFSYTVVPNERILLDQGIPLQMIGEFRQFLPLRLISNYTPFDEKDKGHEMEVQKIMTLVEKKGYKSGFVEHLGRRGHDHGFLNIPLRMNVSNNEWFQGQFPEEDWKPIVDHCIQRSQNTVQRVVKKQINLTGARNLIDQKLASREAHNRYYGLEEDGDIQKLRQMYDVIYQSLNQPILRLQSACVLLLINGVQE